MNLILDSGNSSVKWGIFDHFEMVNEGSFRESNPFIVNSLLRQYSVSHILISDVANREILIPDISNLKVLKMSYGIKLPVQINYETPETLGPDRLAAAIYAAFTFPNRTVLVIQAGTCITYELVDETGTYQGGAIAPGLDMRLKALHTFTAKLPLINKISETPLTGKSTTESILSGVINGCLSETDGMIDLFKDIYPDLICIFGGGDTFFFDKRLKNRIFATANLVLKGLNIVLEHNK